MARDQFQSEAVSLSSQKELIKIPRRHGMRRREILAWVAVAASLLLAVGAWVSQGENVPIAMVGPAQARQALVRSADDLIQLNWATGKTVLENPVSGDVIWSTDQQSGFMRFVGLPPNDPTKEQYQLWIIDPSRDDEPIDGGVFDIVSDGEIIIPIDAKLKVDNPAAFAITIEKPGGVVVSTQERLPLIAYVSEPS